MKMTTILMGIGGLLVGLVAGVVAFAALLWYPTLTLMNKQGVDQLIIERTNQASTMHYLDLLIAEVEPKPEKAQLLRDLKSTRALIVETIARIDSNLSNVGAKPSANPAATRPGG